MRVLQLETVPQQEQLAAWAGRELGATFHQPYLALAVVDSAGEPVGALIFNNYTPRANIEISAVGRGIFTASVARWVCRYVFGQLGCARLTLRTRRSNKTVRRLLSRHFIFEATLRLYYGDEDALLYRMCRDECPLIGTKPNG